MSDTTDRIVGGFWTPKLHRVHPNAPPSRFNGAEIWWAPCHSMFVELPHGIDLNRFEKCTECFPREPAGG
jgi:hypothetical protein